MKSIVLIGVVLVIHAVSLASTAVAAENPNILTWPRMKADEFGCYLEKTFGVQDTRFNCALQGYVNHGDPCQNTDAYYEGPAFPDDHAAQIDPLVKSVALSWEHGELQALTVDFKQPLTRAQIIARFHLPDNFSYPAEYQNIMSIAIQECSQKGNCLIFQGFDHIGAGEVDCEQTQLSNAQTDGSEAANTLNHGNEEEKISAGDAFDGTSAGSPTPDPPSCFGLVARDEHARTGLLDAGDIAPAAFQPCGELMEEQTFEDYTVRIYKADPGEAAAFEIRKGTERVYAYQGGPILEISQFWVEDPQTGADDLWIDSEIPMGQNITGNGIPNLVIYEWAGGAYCCAAYHIFELGPQFRKIATIDAGEYPLQIADLDHNGSLEFTIHDWSFRNYREWNRAFGTYCNPRVILRYRDGSYEVAQDLMRQPTPTMEALQAQANVFIEILAHKPAAEVKQFNESKEFAELTFWRAMLDLFYAGHADLVEPFLAMVFPDNPAQQTECLDLLRAALPRSPYWSQIRAMNAGCSWLPE